MSQNFTAIMPDDDFKNATMLMGALLSVSTLYAGKPSLELARLALSLTEKLASPCYAETPFIYSLAQKLLLQWSFVIRELEEADGGITQYYAG